VTEREGRHPVTQSPMRRAIARRMTESKQQVPHFYLSTEIGMDALLDRVAEVNAGRSREDRVTVTAFLLRAVALTLAEHPTFNAVWADGAIQQVDAINIGVAIALDDGLIAPALLDCRERGVADLAAGLADLVTRTKAGKLRAPEIGEGTFTLSNLGMFDVTAFTAIVTPPQVAILATARTVERPVVADGEIVVRRVMTATLSSDHRVVDGVGAARFLGTLQGLVEAPADWAVVEG
jgi:pyruvate dehydrogenase E2 component (dihydrolipoamide acetyltransferase)